MTPDQPETYTYRGRSLEELVPRIRSELGDDAVIVARRETTSGGVGGFFAKREIEVEVRPGEATAAHLTAAFAQQLAEAHERHRGSRPGPAELAGGRPATGPEIDAIPAPPTPADMTVDDLFPAPPAPQSEGLAALFNAGIVEPPAPAPAAPEAERPPESEELPEEEPAAEVVEAEPEVDQPTGVFDYLGVGAEDEPRVAAEREPEPERAAPEPVAAASEPEPEPEPVAAAPALTPAPESPPVVTAPAVAVPAPGLPIPAREAADRLIARGLRPALAEAVAEEAIASLLPLEPDAEPRALIVDALARRIPAHPLRRGPAVVGFVGPGGAGKTRCVARLAAAHARHGHLPVSVLSVRSPDGGAELTRLLAPYDVALHAVDGGAEGAARIAALRGEGLVVVDTPGISPRSPGELRALGDELRALAPDELHLTVSATTGSEAARELVGGVRELGVSAVVVTHTDETEILGTVIGLAADCQLPISYLARGQAVEAGLSPASPAALAAGLLS
jgi:flagellar biosynthesis GTPase FlhF